MEDRYPGQTIRAPALLLRSLLTLVSSLRVSFILIFIFTLSSRIVPDDLFRCDTGQRKEVDYCFLCVCSISLIFIYLFDYNRSLLWCAGSLVVTCSFLVAACGIQSPEQGLNSGLLHREH